MESQQKEMSGHSAVSSYIVVRAVQDYTAKSKHEVSFVQGDRLQIIEEIDESAKNIWLQARHLDTMEEGYIPTRLIEEDDGSPLPKRPDCISKKRSKEKNRLKTKGEKQVELYNGEDIYEETRMLAPLLKTTQSGEIFLKVLEDYMAKSKQEVNCREGDNLFLMEDYSEVENKTWIQVRNLRNHAVGYIPTRIVIPKEISQQNTDKNSEAGNEEIQPPQQNETLPTDDNTSVISTEESVSKAGVTLKALYSFTPKGKEEIAFEKGDRLLLIEDYDQSEPCWIFARNLRTSEEGYIPSNYVVKEEVRTEAQEHSWYFEVERDEANYQLLLPGLPSGTFLIRKSLGNEAHVLSIRVWSEKGEENIVKHYRIRSNKSNEFFIKSGCVFPSLARLVEHYKGDADCLCSRLTEVCPKIRKADSDTSVEGLEVKRESVEIKERIGGGDFSDVYKGKLKNSVDVAVKMCKPEKMTLSQILSEAKIMHSFQHPNILKLLAVCTKTVPRYIVTELMPHGSLIQYLKEEKVKNSLTFSNIIQMIKQVASGMILFERSNYVHRDLRSRSIFVGGANMVKIADFRLARETNLVDKDGNKYFKLEKTEQIAVFWTPPETFQH